MRQYIVFALLAVALAGLPLLAQSLDLSEPRPLTVPGAVEMGSPGAIRVQTAGVAVSTGTGTAVASEASRDGLQVEFLAAQFDGTYIPDSSGRGRERLSNFNPPTSTLPAGPYDDGAGDRYLVNVGQMRMGQSTSYSYASASQDYFTVAVHNASYSAMHIPYTISTYCPYYWGNGTTHYVQRGSGTDATFTTGSSLANAKHAIIVSHAADGTTKLYVDGTEVTPARGLTANAVTGGLCIGSWNGSYPVSSWRWYSFRVYSGRLPTAAEIAATYWGH